MHACISLYGFLPRLSSRARVTGRVCAHFMKDARDCFSFPRHGLFRMNDGELLLQNALGAAAPAGQLPAPGEEVLRAVHGERFRGAPGLRTSYVGRALLRGTAPRIKARRGRRIGERAFFPPRGKRARGGEYAFVWPRAHGGRFCEKGAGSMWIAIVAVTLVTLLFAWALCRAAARADQHMAETFFRRQEEALGRAEDEDEPETAGDRR